MLRVQTCLVLAAAATLVAARADAQPQPGAGRATFESRCAVCHGSDGHGGDTGPSIVFRLPLLNEADLTSVIRDGRPAKGMPPQPMPAPELQALTRYLRAIERRERPLERTTLQTTDGRTLTGANG